MLEERWDSGSADPNQNFLCINLPSSGIAFVYTYHLNFALMFLQAYVAMLEHSDEHMTPA